MHEIRSMGLLPVSLFNRLSSLLLLFRIRIHTTFTNSRFYKRWFRGDRRGWVRVLTLAMLLGAVSCSVYGLYKEGANAGEGKFWIVYNSHYWLPEPRNELAWMLALRCAGEDAVFTDYTEVRWMLVDSMVLDDNSMRAMGLAALDRKFIVIKRSETRNMALLIHESLHIILQISDHENPIFKRCDPFASILGY